MPTSDSADKPQPLAHSDGTASHKWAKNRTSLASASSVSLALALNRWDSHATPCYNWIVAARSVAPVPTHPNIHNPSGPRGLGRERCRYSRDIFLKHAMPAGAFVGWNSFLRPELPTSIHSFLLSPVFSKKNQHQLATKKILSSGYRHPLPRVTSVISVVSVVSTRALKTAPAVTIESSWKPSWILRIPSPPSSLFRRVSVTYSHCPISTLYISYLAKHSYNSTLPHRGFRPTFLPVYPIQTK